MKKIIFKFFALTLSLLMVISPFSFEVNGRFVNDFGGIAHANFQSILNPNQAANFSELCYDVDQVSQIILLYNQMVTVFATSSPMGQVTGALVGMAENSDTISKICATVIAVGTAKDMNSAMRAAKLANRLYNLGAEGHLARFEDTVGFYNFLDNLKNSNQSLKSKLLNVNNHRRVLNWSFRNLPLDGIDAKIIEQQKLKEARRFEQLAALNQTINGCRVPIVETGPNEVKTPDGNVSVSEMQRMTTDMNKYGKQQNVSSGHVKELFALIRRMVAEVTTAPKELNGSLTILNGFVKEGIYAGVGYAPPVDKTTTDGVTQIIENRFAKYEPEENVEEGIVPIEKRPKTIKVEDGSTVFYKNTGKTSMASCRNPEEQLEKWVLLNSEVLIDPFIKGEWIAQSLRVCPLGSGTSILNKFKTASLGVTPSDEEIDKAIKEATKAVEENCKKRRIEDFFNDMNDLKVLADGRREMGSAYRKTPDPCKLTKAQVDNLRPAIPAQMEGITDMKQWLDHYNEKFNSFIKREYDLALTENAVSDSIREFSGDLSRFMRAGDDGSYNSKNAWDLQAGNRMSSEQIRFLNSWKRPDITCSLPKSLARKYQGTPSEKIIEDPTANPEAYYNLVQQCLQEERNASNNVDTFRTTFEAMVDSMYDLAEAKMEIFRIELLTGAFKGEGGRKPVGCYETIKPADLNLAQARTGLVLAEGIEALNEGINALYRIELEREQRIREEAKEVELRNVKAMSDIRRSKIELGAEKVDLYSNPAYKWEDTMPSFIEQKTRIEEFGHDPSSLN